MTAVGFESGTGVAVTVLETSGVSVALGTGTRVSSAVRLGKGVRDGIAACAVVVSATEV
jgi:hypothetical protein